MKRASGSIWVLCPLGGGVLVALSLPPFASWPLAIFGVALIAVAVQGRSLRARAVAGFMAGIGQLTVGLFWADKFTFVGYLALVLVQSGMFAAACALSPGGRGRVPALAGALMLAEWARDSWPFGGVPPGGIALGQLGGPLAGTARVGGSLLVAFATYLAGASIGDLAISIYRKSRAAGRREDVGLLGAGLCLAVVLALVLFGALAPDGGRPSRTLRVAIVQGGGRRGLSDLQIPASVVYTAALRATSQVHSPVGLVVWPEDIVALSQSLRSSPESAQLSLVARRLHTTLLAGVTETVGSRRFRNEIVAYGPSGAIVASFEKVHRVPFGEYVPWRWLFSHLASLRAVPRDAIAGHASGSIETPAGNLALLVSYEVFFDGRGRSGVRAGGQLIVVPTNTSSYSGAQAPSQEIAASRLQAIAEGRDLVQAAPTGYSAVIDNHGQVLQQSALSVSTVLRANVPLRDGTTLYARFGDAPSLLVALAALLGSWMLVTLRRRREPRDQGGIFGASSKGRVDGLARDSQL